MSDPGKVLVVLSVLSAITVSIKVIVNGVLRYQENQFKYMSGGTGAAGSGATDARLERIEHAVDAIAIEVERIAEGQRFTTKLLSDRGSALSSANRVGS